MSLGEIRRGVEMEAVKNPASADAVYRWLLATEIRFASHVLPVTTEIAYRWGAISADRTRPVVDTYLAATAIVHGLTLVTRNERDFVGINVRLLNPWR